MMKLCISLLNLNFEGVLRFFYTYMKEKNPANVAWINKKKKTYVHHEPYQKRKKIALKFGSFII